MKFYSQITTNRKALLGLILTGCMISTHAADRPKNYVTVCKVGQTCTVSAATNVAFGASDKFVYKVLNGTFSCTVSAFGSDPIPSKVNKECSIPKSGSGAVSSPSSSSSAASSSAASGKILSQTGNPVADWFSKSKTKWGTDKADIVLSYQQSNGGWPKNLDYNSVSKGSGGSASGTFDNNATVTEIVYLAEIYKSGKNTKYRDAVRKAANFMLSAQYSSGGWPQFYPLKGGYADHVTFNDNAMGHLLTVLDSAVNKKAPFDTDVFSDNDRAKFKTAVTKGVQYILKSQWKQNGKLTVWCAQHGATDYKPKAARAYELESLSGSESAGLIAFLMTQPQTTEIQTAVKAGLTWFNSPNTYLDGYTYDSAQAKTNPIVKKSGSRMWYRFYDLNTNKGFFSDRDGSKFYDITKMSEERRTGYSWGGAYGEKILSYAKSVGY